MKKSLLILGVILTFSFSMVAQTTPEVKNLRTEYLRNPVGIDVKTPLFIREILVEPSIENCIFVM